jgi:hypothetical protein
VSDRFWVLSNPVLPAHADYLALDGAGTRGVRPWLVRNTAAMLSSHDLVHWDVEQIFLYSANIDSEAFQYLQFDFDGDDLVVAARTAFDVGGTKPWRGHDSNLTTFHRIEDFRTAQARQVVTISGSAVLRSELTQHDPAPLGSFARGTSFAGAPLTSATALGQAGDGDVYIAEAGGRVLRESHEPRAHGRLRPRRRPVGILHGGQPHAPCRPGAGRRPARRTGDRRPHGLVGPPPPAFAAGSAPGLSSLTLGHSVSTREGAACSSTRLRSSAGGLPAVSPGWRP